MRGHYRRPHQWQDRKHQHHQGRNRLIVSRPPRQSAGAAFPFDCVSPEHAWKEGEGDRSLVYWRSVHRQAFAPDYEAAGAPFDEQGLCVLEEFAVVFAE